MPIYKTYRTNNNRNYRYNNRNNRRNKNNEFGNLKKSKYIRNRDIRSFDITKKDILALNKKASKGTLTNKDFKGKFEKTKFIAIYLSKIKDKNLFYQIEPLLEYLSNRIIGDYHGSTILRTYLLYSEKVDIDIVKYLLGKVNNATFSLDVNAINHYRSNSIKSYLENQYITLDEDIFDLLLENFDPNGIIENYDNPDRTTNINLINHNVTDNTGTGSTLLHAICKNHPYFNYGIQKLLDLGVDPTLTCTKRYLKKCHKNIIKLSQENITNNNNDDIEINQEEFIKGECNNEDDSIYKYTALDILKLNANSNNEFDESINLLDNISTKSAKV